MKLVIGALCAAWLFVGGVAADGRDYYGHGVGSCDAAATVAVTIAAGPFNYGGWDPTVTCPAPS